MERGAVREFASGVSWTATMSGRDLVCPRCLFGHATMLCGHMGSDAAWVCDRCFYWPGWSEEAKS